MPTVGRILASERIRQGLDVNSVAEITKITPRALRAIEADDFEQLPGLMFARNFVRQYAQALKLDGAAAVEQFNREQSMAEPDLSALAKAPAIHVPGMSRPVWRRVLDENTVSAFFTLVLTLAACGGAFYGFQYWRARHAAQTAQQASSQPGPAKVESKAAPPDPAQQPPAQTNSESPAVTPTDADSAAADAPSPANVHVAVEATEPCWARVTVDGKTLFTGTLTPGDAKMFDGAANVSIRAGNAGALAIKLNGNDVPAIGPKGQIRIVDLTASGAQVRTPTPDPVLDF
jgi:cytoskeletal protein RodZ